MIRVALFLVLISSFGLSDSLNSPLKNPSMAVTGTQRVSTDIVVSAGGGAEPGTYAYFNMTSCPSGWVAANGANGTVDLRGTFIRSLDSGRGIDPSRAIGSYQADAFQGHAFGQSNTNRLGYVSVQASGGSHLYAGFSSAFSTKAGIVSDGINGTPRIDDETRPKNVALLACMKQ